MMMQELTTLTMDSPDPAILVVEDDRLLRQMTIETLAGEGLATIGVDSAEEGLAFLGCHPAIKLLITDINMPGMNGIELLALVQAKYPSVQMMAFSGRANLVDGSLPTAAAFLAKPFTARQLLSQVYRMLAGGFGTHYVAER